MRVFCQNPREPLARGCEISCVTLILVTASESNLAVVNREVRPPSCPRCGYDQRGVIVTWKESCPLEGVCSECGLAFTWHEVLRRDQLAPKWSVEFTPRRRGLPLATLKTFLRTLWPWGFWKRMNMAYAIHWLRIAAYLLILLTPMLVGYVAAQSIAAGIMLHQTRSQLATYQRSTPQIIARLQSMSSSSSLPVTAVPIFSFVDRSMREQRRLNMIVSLQQLQRTPELINHSYAAAAFEAVFMPTSEDSIGTITRASFNGNGVMTGLTDEPYPFPPASLWSSLLSSTTAFSSGYRSGAWNECWPAFGTILFWTLFLLAPFPLSLALLPVTRKKAKVRWAHIGRVFSYSLSIPIMLAQVAVAAWVAVTLGFRAARFDEETLMGPVAVLMPVLVMCFWGAAIKRYLRLPHAAAVTILLSVLCVLTVSGVVFWVGRLMFS